DFQTVLLFELFEVPPELQSVTHKLIRRHLEEYDYAGFIELAGAPIYELHADCRLAGTNRTFYQDHIAPRNAAGQNIVEAGDTGLDEISLRHTILPWFESQATACNLPFARGKAAGGLGRPGART